MEVRKVLTDLQMDPAGGALTFHAELPGLAGAVCGHAEVPAESDWDLPVRAVLLALRICQHALCAAPDTP